ncbi:TPA: hypothetical protein ACH3X2_008662 [Trebouxia sp. C0005]
MKSRDSEPLKSACKCLQDRWIEASRHVGAVHSFCGTHLQRLLISSGMVNHAGPSGAHFHRRKPAFASVSLDNNPSSGKRRRKHKEQDEPGEEEHLSKKERKKRMVERAKVQLNEMTREERQELYHYVQTQKWLNKKVEFDGEKKSIRQLIREVEDEEGEAPQAQEGGVVDYTGRNKTAGVGEVPGWMLRPGAPKMQLRPEEEEQLPLDLLGRGTLWSKRPLLGYAFGGLRDVGFGVYARVDRIRGSLQERWAGQDPEKVLLSEGFYQDIITHGSGTELTLMAVPSRNIPLPTLRKHVEKRMMENLQLVTKGQDDTNDVELLKSMCGTLDGKHLAKTGFVKGDNILSGTNFIFSTNKKGHFSAEAMTPEKELKDKRMVPLWTCKNPKLTYAFFAMVLGPNPVCNNAKYNIGQGALYVTNGFKFGPNPENPAQVLTGPDDEAVSPFPQPLNFQDVQKQLKTGPSTQAFGFDENSEGPMKVLSSRRHSKREWKAQRNRGSTEFTEMAT